MGWNRALSESRVKQALQDFNAVEVTDLTREIDLAGANIPLNRAYRVNAVHAYVEIVNASTLLGGAVEEGERLHKRYLRFLHLFQRAVHLGVLATTDVFKVDHQNHRAHLVLYKPYGDEAVRVSTMVTTVNALLKLLLAANELHEELPDVQVRIGIESGVCLAVRNGTRGDREALFLGDAANRAAKLLAGTRLGVYLGTNARTALGGSFLDAKELAGPLTESQIATCLARSESAPDAEKLLARWKQELADTPLAEFTFSRPTPPLSSLDLDALTPLNSRRLTAAAIMADVDGFTAFVAKRMPNAQAAGEAIRVLHVVRKELRDVLADFGGRKVRYLGDCVQGVLAEGASSTDAARTSETALFCAAAMRDAFGVIQTELPAAKELGLAIGLDLGPLSLTRLGVKGSRDRCVAGRAMFQAEAEQKRCDGNQTAIGAALAASAGNSVQRVFGESRILSGLSTNRLDALLRQTEAASGRVVTDSSGSKIVLPKAYGQ